MAVTLARDAPCLAGSTDTFSLAKVCSGLSDIEVMDRFRYGTIRDRVRRAAVGLRGRRLNDVVAARVRELLSMLAQRHPAVDYVQCARAYDALTVLPPQRLGGERREQRHSARAGGLERELCGGTRMGRTDR